MKTDDQPQTLQEAIIYFDDLDNALNFIVKLRWPNGVVCPRCAGAVGDRLSAMVDRDTCLSAIAGAYPARATCFGNWCLTFRRF